MLGIDAFQRKVFKPGQIGVVGVNNQRDAAKMFNNGPLLLKQAPKFLFKGAIATELED